MLQINTIAKGGSISRIMESVGHEVVTSGGSSVIAHGRGGTPMGNGAFSFYFGSRVDFYRHVMRNFLKGEMGFGSYRQTERLISFIRDIRPDVIHLHNLHGFYLHIEVLFAYLKEAHIPIVWTLHDCWPFTGQCAHFTAAKCEKWKTGCYDCPIYRTNYPYSLFKDNSRENYQRKKEAFCGVKDLTIVTPSRWLANCVKESFLKNYKVQVIPNGVDREVFHAFVDEELTSATKKNIWMSTGRIMGDDGFSNNHSQQKVVLGVANIWTQNKGLSAFERLAKELPPGYRIVLIGLSKMQIKRLSKTFRPDRLLPLPKTSDKIELATWYNYADVFVNPTLEDNFPTTNLEALSCGCPVVTYNSGGSAECIDDGCGIIVAKGDIKDLLQAVQKAVLYDRRECEQHAKSIYDSHIMNERYIACYNKAIASVNMNC